MIFESAGHGQIDLSKVLPVLVELSETNPVGIKLEDVRIKKRYIDDYKIKIDRYNARQQTAAMVSPSNGNVKLKEADPYCGLMENVYEKVVANQVLDKFDLQSILMLFPGYGDVYTYIILKGEVLLLEDRYNEYIDAFIQGDLIAPFGTRYFSSEKQRQILWEKIKSLADDQGAKNFILTVEDVMSAFYSASGDPANTMQCRTFETVFSLERTGDIEITQIRDDEFVVSLGIKHLKGSASPAKVLPAYAKFENKFSDYELHWYCPVCGRKVKVFESKQELETFLQEGGSKKCERGHENKLTVVDDKVIFEHTPMLVSKAMEAFKALHKKSVSTQVDKNSKSV